MIVKSKIRTLSGVTPVAFLVKAYPCPGQCIYCPTENGMPQSYLSHEPAVMRAIANDFDPVKQIWQRLKMYETSGHAIDKIEIIIIGGTWSYYPINYQRQVIWSVYWALNNYQEPEVRRQELGKKNITNKDIEIEKRKNETVRCRCVGMSIETRPDYINIEEVKKLRNYGVTRVELGVQTVDEKILKLIKRGHGRKEIIKATKFLKDAGFKVCYHLMPNLPGSTPQKDYQVFKEIFDSPDFRPDQLKIYPCVLAGESELRKWYEDGRWKPYSDKVLVSLLCRIKSEIIPRYVRIMRVWRDIPATEVEAGSEMSHMRQVISRQLTADSLQCKCIRCREIMDRPQEKKLFLRRKDYSASGGKEIFLEYVDKFDRIYGLLRLRISHFKLTTNRCKAIPPFRWNTLAPDFPTLSVLKNGGIVRELHVFGQSVKLSHLTLGVVATPGVYSEVQHHGLGKKLMTEAERIIKKEFKLPKMAIISGIGVREYYRQLEYRLEDEYMVKSFL